MKLLLKIAFYLSITVALIIAADKSGQNVKNSDKVAGVRNNNRNDTIVLNARLVEIPSKFPANDLYNYVYILKYQVISVVKGIYNNEEIFIGQYNPLIPRNLVKDKMDKFVDGNLEQFEPGAVHRMVIIKSIDKVWKDAVEDNYFDIDSEKYFAIKTDIVQ